MKILHVVPTYFPAVRYGGPIFSVHGLCKGQAENVHYIVVYTTDVDGPNSLDVSTNKVTQLDGVNVHYFKADQQKPGWSRRLYRSKAMSKALRNSIHEFDIVHLHSVYLWPTWFAARQAKKHNIPYILSPRGMLVKQLIQQKNSWLKRAWLLLIEKDNIKNAAALHYTSEREHSDAAPYVKGQKHSFVLANGITLDEAFTFQSKTFERNQKDVLYLGRLSWKKGLKKLIMAIERLPDMHLIIAGNDEDGYAKKIDTFIKDKQLQQRIELRGFVDGETKQKLLSSVSMLVLCSDNENFGNVVLEAMAVATPVIVTANIGAAEVVKKYRAGLISQDTTIALAENIQHLNSKPMMQRQLGENGRKAVQQYFAWTAIASRMVNHYQSVLKDAP